MELTCACCGIVTTFETEREAYRKGWDTPSMFTVPATTCNLCPDAPIIMHGIEKARERHRPLHEKWEKEGRPREMQLSEELALDRKKGVR